MTTDGNILIYDINSVPDNMAAADIYKWYKELGIIFYDSTGGDKPDVINLNNNEQAFMMVDVV